MYLHSSSFSGVNLEALNLPLLLDRQLRLRLSQSTIGMGN